MTGGRAGPGGAAGGLAGLEESADDLYENAPCGYLSARPDGTIVRVNATLLAWTGFARDELVGRRRFPDLLTAGGRIYHETHYAPLLQMQGAVREIALEIVCADGRRLPVLVNSTLLRDADGRPQVVRTTVFDATDRKRYERELMAAREDERAARERVERLQRITSALAATLSPGAVAAAVVDGLVEGGVVRGAAVCTYRPAQPRASLLAARGLDDDEVSRALGQGGEGWADPVEGPVYADDDSAGSLPLLADGRLAGILHVVAPAGEPLGDDDRALLGAVAAQGGSALDRARLRAEATHEAERLARLALASRAMEEARGSAARARRLVEVVVPDLADWASVEVAAGDGTTLLAGTPPVGDVVDGARLVALPLRTRAESLGTFTLGRAPDRAPFAAADLPFLTDLAERACLALEIALILEQQRDIAHGLQMSLLADALPVDARVALATTYQPAVETLEVGGDWYDAFRIGPDLLAVVVGDVVGRGLGAAATMGQLRSAIRALALTGQRPAALLEALDRFAHQLPAARWATVVYGEVDLERSTFRFACAGHPPPLIIDPGAEPRYAWDGRSAPLAALPRRIARADCEIDLIPGSRLLLYTDGLIEVKGEVIDVGLARLTREAGRRPGGTVEEMVAAVSDAMLAGRASRDDVCMLCVEMRADTPPRR